MANPKHARLEHRVRMTQEKIDRAIREFEVALKIDPEDAASAYQLAVLYQKTGATARAEELFAKVGKARAQGPAHAAPPNLVRIIREGSR